FARHVPRQRSAVQSRRVLPGVPAKGRRQDVPAAEGARVDLVSPSRNLSPVQRRSEMPLRPLFIARFAVTLSSLAAATAFAGAAPPVAPVKPVTDTYFGVTVTDPYRYMENMKDPDVAAWVKAQADYTHALLSKIP